MWKYILIFWWSFCSLPIQAQNLRVVTSDWAVAETLQAMGHPPLAVGDKRAYQRWVQQPVLSDHTVDIGTRLQPNRALLLELHPQLFIDTPLFSSIHQQLNHIAPVHKVVFNQDDGYSWPVLVKATHQIGALVADPTAAETLIHMTQSKLAYDKHRLRQLKKQPPPLLIVQFIDGRHVRVYGHNSLYQVALDQLGLNNAWTKDGNSWGFDSVALTALVHLPENTRLIVIQPYARYIARQVQHSALWQKLPLMQQDDHIVLPPSWSFGALPSVARFGRLLTDALIQNHGAIW